MPSPIAVLQALAIYKSLSTELPVSSTEAEVETHYAELDSGKMSTETVSDSSDKHKVEEAVSQTSKHKVEEAVNQTSKSVDSF